MKDIIRGVIVGLGKVIPGVSGSMLAISLGIYEKCVNSFINITKNINNVIFLTKILIGVLISIIFGSKILYYFFTKYYSYIIILFIGLIIGSINDVRIKSQKKYWYITLFFFIFMYLLSKNNFILNLKEENIIFLYLISGFIESMSSIIPGVSGTALLMSIGMYDKVLNIFSSFYTLYNNISIILPFFIGIIIGLVISILLVNYLLNKYKYQMNNAILGMSYSTIMIMIEKINISLKLIPVYLLLLILGFVLIKKVNHFF